MNQTQQLPTLKEIRSHGTKAFPCAIYQNQSPKKGIMVKHHWHDEIEIIYFLGGNFRLEINMEQFDIRSECLYFINPGELHSIVAETYNPPEESAVVFAPGILSFDSYDAAQMQLIQPIQNGKMLFPRCLKPDHPAFHAIRDAFMDIIGSTLTNDLTAQLYIKSSLLRILAILSKYRLIVPTEENYNKRVESIKAVLKYIKDNYHEKIYIQDLANLINMNEQYFCRFFKKAIGRSPIGYVNEYRIKQSIRLLKETDLPVTEICLECGFNNLGNFLREFRKYTDTTPLKYRNHTASQEK